MSANREKVFTKLKLILSAQLSVDPEAVQEDALIAEDLGADSLDTAEIVMVIKDELGYDMLDEEIMKVKTVKNMLDLLSEKVQNDAF